VIRPLFPIKNKNIISNIIAKSATHISVIKLFVTGIFAIVPVRPNTKSILNILLQTILPIAISACFLREATTEVTSSGAEVPNATIVNHIIDSGTLNDTAILTADHMSKSAHNANHINPRTMYRNDKVILCC